MFVVFD